MLAFKEHFLGVVFAGVYLPYIGFKEDVQFIGYDEAAKIAKTALKNGTTLKYETLKTGLVKEKDYEKIVDPKKMIYPS